MIRLMQVYIDTVMHTMMVIVEDAKPSCSFLVLEE